MASDQRNPFNKSAIIKLQHLKPNTKYIVRGIIITINNKTFIDENLPHAAFTTKCFEIKDEDFFFESVQHQHKSDVQIQDFDTIL
jgi:Ran GTPase-activating protein (RanGAP) involved in mRNA processing and transport